MSRSYKPPEPRANYDRDERETITSDTGGPSTYLREEMIGMGVEELLTRALELMAEHDAEVASLMKHLPMKFEKRVRAANGPQARARNAINASRILLGNAQAPLQRVEYRERR